MRCRPYSILRLPPESCRSSNIHRTRFGYINRPPKQKHTSLMTLCLGGRFASEAFVSVCVRACPCMLYAVCAHWIKRIIVTRRAKRIEESNGCFRCGCCCISFDAAVASSLYIGSTHVDDRSCGSDVSLLSSVKCTRVYLCSVGEYMN
jgi:hypothetical protein